MTYSEVLSYLFNQLPVFQRVGKSAYKANLNNTNALDKYFSHPHKHFKSIHIAGTNGKGSVSHILADIYKNSGYNVGLYTSPHLLDFRERIRVNDEMINENDVVEFVESNMEFFSTLKPSFFEITVAMAFYYFKKKKVDIAIIETGLGGRLDSTNIITPELSIITNIGLDHTEFLGNTLEDIAAEKGGIIKNGVPVLIGRKQSITTKVFEKIAHANSTTLSYTQDMISCRLSKDVAIINDLRNDNNFSINTKLTGSYQEENLSTALSAIQIMQGMTINISKLKEINPNIWGRWQLLNDCPKVICDTGHNTDGIKEVVKNIKTIGYDKLHIVFGMVNDKNIDSIIDLLPRNAKYYITKANIPRAMDEKDLYNCFVGKGYTCSIQNNVKDAYIQALEHASKTDLIFIGGSTFVVADLLSYLKDSEI